MINAVAVVQEFYRAMGAGDSTLRRCFLLILSGQGQKASRTTAVCGVGRKLSSITFCFRKQGTGTDSQQSARISL